MDFGPWVDTMKETSLVIYIYVCILACHGCHGHQNVCTVIIHLVSSLNPTYGMDVCVHFFLPPVIILIILIPVWEFWQRLAPPLPLHHAGKTLSTHELWE